VIDLYSNCQQLEDGSKNLFRDMKTFLTNKEQTYKITKKIINSSDSAASPIPSIALDKVRLTAPISNPEKIICIGLNYYDHAKECNMPVPTEPVLFSKYSSSIIGPDDIVIKPKTTQELDYEVELVIVIGKQGKRLEISKLNAMDYVAGYMIGNDVSARDWQLKKSGGQWMAGKTFDTFAPLGPCIQTISGPSFSEELTEGEKPSEWFDPHNARIRCLLNGKPVQDSNTNQLIFKTPDILSYLSQIMTLKPGDLIFTGTPYGVGFARKPPICLNVGDELHSEIEGLGIDGFGYLRNRIGE